jgi:hypothetical protein
MTQEADTRANFPHYHKSVAHLEYVDVYRVLDLFGVTNPAIQHAVKKLLVPGRRGSKDIQKDLREAVVSINRALQMIAEDEQPPMYPLGEFMGPAIVADIIPVYFCTYCRLNVQSPCPDMKCPCVPCDGIPDCRYVKGHDGACKPRLMPAGV